MPGFTPPPILARLLACIARLRMAATEPGILREDLVRNDRLNAFLWLSHILAGIQSLVARLQKGSLPPPQPRRPGPPAASQPLPRDRLPRTAGWLAAALPGSEELATLATLLADPSLAPLLAQAPTRFARLLRPLCRATGLPLPAALAQPTPPKKPAPAPAASPAPPTRPLAPPTAPKPNSLKAALLTNTRLDISPIFALLPDLQKTA